jgi:hydroxymethylglutaryl-CoA reductase (NADPH)
VRENIGKGIANLGPTMTLDTVVEVLLISIGTISGKGTAL